MQAKVCPVDASSASGSLGVHWTFTGTDSGADENTLVKTTSPVILFLSLTAGYLCLLNDSSFSLWGREKVNSTAHRKVQHGKASTWRYTWLKHTWKDHGKYCQWQAVSWQGYAFQLKCLTIYWDAIEWWVASSGKRNFNARVKGERVNLLVHR